MKRNFDRNDSSSVSVTKTFFETTEPGHPSYTYSIFLEDCSLEEFTESTAKQIYEKLGKLLKIES